jgi:hypothetical protein
VPSTEQHFLAMFDREARGIELIESSGEDERGNVQTVIT